MYPDVVDDDETDNEELPEKVKSIVNVKTEEEDTDYETDNDTQPSQVESNDKIKKENYGSYDDETDNEELPEKVKSNNLDVKIEEEDTDNEWVEGYATSYQSVSWLNYLFRVVVNLSKERINYQMAAVGGIRIEFLCVVLRGEYYVMQIWPVFFILQYLR